jgi:ATP/maltotriose-dependent transcriptional regulator MalT
MNSRDLPKNPLQRLEAVPNVRLILLLGPPGCGKSALLRRWVSARQRAPAALVSLTAHDDSPTAFTQRLIRSLDGSAKLGAEARSQGLANLNLEGQSALLLSILEGAPAGFALVLDDCHQI